MHIEIDVKLCRSSVKCDKKTPVCLDVCPLKLISFRGGVAQISNKQNCDFCGLCASACAAEAIVIGE